MCGECRGVPVGVGRVVAQGFEQLGLTGEDLGQQAVGGMDQIGHIRSADGVSDGASLAGGGHDPRAS